MSGFVSGMGFAFFIACVERGTMESAMVEFLIFILFGFAELNKSVKSAIEKEAP